MLTEFSQVATSIKPGSIYEHYKGQQYKIINLARHSETLEELVVYQALYGTQEIWVRPVELFLGKITIYGFLQPRFRLISIYSKEDTEHVYKT